MVGGTRREDGDDQGRVLLLPGADVDVEDTPDVVLGQAHYATSPSAVSDSGASYWVWCSASANSSAGSRRIIADKSAPSSDPGSRRTHFQAPVVIRTSDARPVKNPSITVSPGRTAR